ncbi:hypothetical protein [Corynebacterium variabile]|uniref:hypothetical protein n=1 Tax=Corynebacterium variabile TaxID=1727 RepID=UPI003F906438
MSRFIEGECVQTSSMSGWSSRTSRQVDSSSVRPGVVASRWTVAVATGSAVAGAVVRMPPASRTLSELSSEAVRRVTGERSMGFLSSMVIVV